MRVAVDVMGGDHAPQEVLRGCWAAAAGLNPDDAIVLVGDRRAIESGLAESGLSAGEKSRFQIVATTEVIAMDESPVEAVRAKPRSSIVVMSRLSAEGEVDAVISAGNTGAMVAAAHLRMRLLPGVSRPGIAIVLPTFHGPVVLCDAGANISPKVKHLQQYAIMGAAYAAVACGIEEPRVGLLNVGEEDAKGTALLKETNKLMRREQVVRFIGNIEGRDLFEGAADVAVCDGFVGNVVLKCYEGMAEGLLQIIGSELLKADPVLSRRFQPILDEVSAKQDWQEYGGAPLLGVNGCCMICHGRSEARAIKNTIGLAGRLVAGHINERIVDAINRSVPVAE